MNVFVLRSFFPGSHIAISKGGVVELPEDKAEYFIAIGDARIATKEDAEKFINSNRAVSF